MPKENGDEPVRAGFKVYPVGYFLLDLTGVQIEHCKLYLLVAINRTPKSAFVELHENNPFRRWRRPPAL